MNLTKNISIVYESSGLFIRTAWRRCYGYRGRNFPQCTHQNDKSSFSVSTWRASHCIWSLLRSFFFCNNHVAFGAFSNRSRKLYRTFVFFCDQYSHKRGPLCSELVLWNWDSVKKQIKLKYDHFATNCNCFSI